MRTRIVHFRRFVGLQYNARRCGVRTDELGRLPDWDAGGFPTGANHRSGIPLAVVQSIVSTTYYRVLVLYFYHSCSLV